MRISMAYIDAQKIIEKLIELNVLLVQDGCIPMIYENGNYLMPVESVIHEVMRSTKSQAELIQILKEHGVEMWEMLKLTYRPAYVFKLGKYFIGDLKRALRNEHLDAIKKFYCDGDSYTYLGEHLFISDTISNESVFKISDDVFFIPLNYELFSIIPLTMDILNDVNIVEMKEFGVIREFEYPFECYPCDNDGLIRVNEFTEEFFNQEMHEFRD